MIAKDGRILRGYYCAKNSSAEASVIIEMGIKQGVCSLTRVDHAGRAGQEQQVKRKKA
jgi:hypothetical protein